MENMLVMSNFALTKVILGDKASETGKQRGNLKLLCKDRERR